MNDVEQKQLDSVIGLTKTKPMTYFLYPTLQASELKLFLQVHRASGACVNKALLDVRTINPNASNLVADDTETSFSQEADDTNLSYDLLGADPNESSHFLADDLNKSRGIPGSDANISRHFPEDDTNRSRDIYGADTNTSGHLSSDNTNRSRDLSTVEGTNALNLSEDDMESSLDWFEDTCELTQQTDNCFECVLRNNDEKHTRDDRKDKPVKLGKRKVILQFLTSVSRQIREQLIPKCTNRTTVLN